MHRIYNFYISKKHTRKQMTGNSKSGCGDGDLGPVSVSGVAVWA